MSNYNELSKHPRKFLAMPGSQSRCPNRYWLIFEFSLMNTSSRRQHSIGNRVLKSLACGYVHPVQCRHLRSGEHVIKDSELGEHEPTSVSIVSVAT